MKFIISSTNLLKSLQTISGVVVSSNTLPILEYFLFEAIDNELKITASDQETTMSITVTPTMMEEGGAIAIPSKILLDTLKTYHDTPLTFITDPLTFAIEIVADNAKFKLSGQDPEDFPKMPALTNPASVNIKGEILVRGISKTIFGTGTDELRPEMTGVFFEFTEEKATLVSTDAHRIIRYRRPDVQSSETMSFIMPKKPLTQLKNTVPIDDTYVLIEYNVQNVRFTFNNVVLTSTLIEGRFPNYEAVIPRDNPNKLIIDRVALMTSIRRVSLFGNQSTHLIRFKIAGQVISLSAEDYDFQNEASEVLPCAYDGEDIEIGFNSKFLLEMLSNIDAPNVRIEMSTPNRAGLLIPETDENDAEDLLMLIMPVMM
ncbi:MAG: DNA polymerase III subunit beta [Lentimicrobium sp.]|nr:DNA polymerase III subunit beta [Bacteroidales bacterium]